MAWTQGELLAVGQVPRSTEPLVTPLLSRYRWMVVNISGGKDSQTALRAAVAEADRQGFPPKRIVTVFADLGDEDEWPGTRELAAEHASYYGLRHEVVWREVGGQQQSLSEHIEQDRGKWPDAARRYCTADMKRAPVYKLLTRLANEAREQGCDGPVPILNVMGMRAQESPKRALMPVFEHDERASNLTRRRVDTWLPIHGWTVDDVWSDIRASGVRYHPVYDKGMPRLSCRFCVLASKSALVRAAQIDPEGAWRRASLEERMGHRFRQDVSMLDILELAGQAGPVPVDDWAA